MSELKPCPFCGNADHMLISIVWLMDSNGDDEIFNRCYVCGARGPTKGNKNCQDTYDSWNRREGDE